MYASTLQGVVSTGCTGTSPHSVVDEGRRDGSPDRRARFRSASHPLLRYTTATDSSDDKRLEMLDAWKLQRCSR